VRAKRWVGYSIAVTGAYLAEFCGEQQVSIQATEAP
jgi:hypothetical protein